MSDDDSKTNASETKEAEPVKEEQQKHSSNDEKPADNPSEDKNDHPCEEKKEHHSHSHSHSGEKKKKKSSKDKKKDKEESSDKSSEDKEDDDKHTGDEETKEKKKKSKDKKRKPSDAAASTTTTTTTSTEGAKKIIFLNCHMFAHTFVGEVYSPLSYIDDIRAAAVAKHIVEANPDIVVLCEVWSSTLNKRIAEDPEVKKILPYSWLDPQMKSRVFSLRRIMGSGMVLLSKEPIKQCGVLEYRNLSGWDACARKCVFAAICGDVMICGTHLEAELDPPGIKCQDDNFLELKQFISKMAAEQKVDRIILAGDLNTSEYEHGKRDAKNPRYDLMCQSMSEIVPPLKDSLRIISPSLTDDQGNEVPDKVAITTDHANNKLTARWGGGDTEGQYRLDYFFVSDKIALIDQKVLRDWKCKDKEGRDEDVSDHYGVVLSFK